MSIFTVYTRHPPSEVAPVEPEDDTATPAANTTEACTEPSEPTAAPAARLQTPGTESGKGAARGRNHTHGNGRRVVTPGVLAER